MPAARPSCLIIADAPEALVSLGGISMIERLLRVLQRLDFVEAAVLTSTLAPIGQHLARPSWARAELKVDLRERAAGDVTASEIGNPHSLGDRILILCGDFYYDRRLLDALVGSETTALLTDSQQLRSSSAALITKEWLARQDLNQPVFRLLETAEVARIDAVDISGYERDQRATIPPVFFPAPSAQEHRAAERVLQQAAQKGTLDIPAMVHAPIETWLVSKIWQTAIRPNHLSLITVLVGVAVTALYASGHLGLGAILALAVGVLDGLDGKLARTKVETTKLGKWEHELDYVVETSWWLALAFYFANSKTVPHAWQLWALLFSCDLLDRATRGWVKKRLNRNLDDVSAFDRLVRLIGGRRNIYTWIFAIALLLGAPAKGFITICCWGIVTSAIHVARALQIRIGAGA